MDGFRMQAGLVAAFVGRDKSRPYAMMEPSPGLGMTTCWIRAVLLHNRRDQTTITPGHSGPQTVRTIFAFSSGFLHRCLRHIPMPIDNCDQRDGDEHMALRRSDPPQRLIETRTTSQPQRIPHQPVLNMRGQEVGLGPLSPELMPVYQRWLNDFELLSLLDRRFRPLTSDWIRTWYDRQSRATGDSLVFTIWDISSNTPIGNAALQDIDARSRTAEFGIFIAELSFRGKGRGTEATRMMLDFAFDTLALENIMLRVYDHNARAIAVYERVGFKVLGRRRGANRRHGSAADVILMDIVRGDYCLDD